MTALLLAALLAVGASARDPGVRVSPGLGRAPTDERTAYELLRDLVPGNDGPATALLNMLGSSGRNLTREQFVANYSDFIGKMQQAQRDGVSLYGINPHSARIPEEKWAEITRLAAQAYDESAAGRDVTLNPSLVRTERPPDPGAPPPPPQATTQELIAASLAETNAAMAALTGRLRAQRGDAAGALQSFDQAVRNGDQSADTLAGRGAAAYQSGDIGKARASAAAALEADPGNKAALAIMKLTEGRVSGETPRAALGGFGAAPRDEAGGGGGRPGLPDPRAPGPAREPLRTEPARTGAGAVAAADAALRMRDYAAAERLAGRAIEAAPGSVPPYVLRSAARSGLGRHEDALSDAEHAVALAPVDATARTRRLDAALGARRYAEALEDADWLVQERPRDAGAHLRRARALAGLGRRAESQEALRRAAQLDPSLAARVDEALRRPENADLDLLFSDAAAPAAAPPPKPRTGLVARGAAAAGGALLLLAALLILVPRARETVLSTISRRPPRLFS